MLQESCGRVNKRQMYQYTKDSAGHGRGKKSQNDGKAGTLVSDDSITIIAGAGLQKNDAQITFLSSVQMGEQKGQEWGNRSVTVHPCFGWLMSVAVPPWSSMIDLTMASPSPLP